MAKKAKITAEQQKALDIIREYGKIVRYQGGFWAREVLSKSYEINQYEQGRLVTKKLYPPIWVSTATIQSLIGRKIITASKYGRNRTGRFPIECKLNDDQK